MAEIKINFDLTFSRRFVRTAGAVAIALCAVPELDSESVTLSTYYPAPSGVYTNMITTSDTYLARDGGNVGIFTTTPGAKLDVNGTTNLRAGITGTFGLVPSYVNWNAYGTGSGGAAIYNSNEAVYQALMLVGNNSGGAVRRVKVWDELTVNGNSIVTGNHTVSGNATISGYVASSSYVRAATAVVSQQGPSCGAPLEYSYPTFGGGTVALCPGQYVTTTTGWYTKYVVLPVDRGPNLVPPVAPTANYICCPCPSSGCIL